MRGERDAARPLADDPAAAALHLGPALAFWRSVGATSHVRQRELLLAAAG